jgi:septation ring formation regulator EzrA
MSEDNNLINLDELSTIMRSAEENFEELSAQRMDDYDNLIKRIILIEKVHKYGSSGFEKKIKEIEDLIEAFIKKEG